MKIQFAGAMMMVASAALASAQETPERPPITFNNSQLKSGEIYNYERKLVAGRPVLISQEQATSLINRFKTNLGKLGNPRMVVYVNRDLVDETSGVKLTERKERIQSNTTEVKSEFKADPSTANAPAQPASATLPTASNVTIVGDINGRRNHLPGNESIQTKTEKSAQENSYKNTEPNHATLADRQTVRDVERLFGRPFRMAGANLADQRIATQLIADRPLQKLQTEGEQARKDREALGKIADVAIEILISSRNIVVPEISGDKTYAVPDIQATAVRLSDARIIGQASATDIIGKDQYAGSIVRNFDVREISEATALALMEDILLSVSE